MYVDSRPHISHHWPKVFWFKYLLESFCIMILISSWECICPKYDQAVVAA